jgi:hypothetical protein
VLDIIAYPSIMTTAQVEKYNETLLQIVEEKRTEWTENIKGLAPLIRSKDPHDMTDAQALALSYRSILLEEIAYFVTKLGQTQKTLKVLKSERFTLYATGHFPDGTRATGNVAAHPLIGNTKLSGPQRDMIISGDLADYEHTDDILEQIILHLRECIKTIDQYMYAIKNRLELFVLFK